MKQSINNYQFHRAFERMDRGEQFSYEGLNALFDYLEELEDDTGETVELDVIALCCEYAEYKNIREYNDEHNYCESISQIRELTTVITIGTESFIIQQF
tara:strand:- start:995 stop:1291 length:297 start_codon:yes stop_codon:yes gene_type:complete